MMTLSNVAQEQLEIEQRWMAIKEKQKTFSWARFHDESTKQYERWA
jgi:hypothetical protein